MTKQQENKQVPGMREQRFGIEIELTGLTRRAAADIIGNYMGTTPVYIGGFYYVYEIPDRLRKNWTHTVKLRQKKFLSRLKRSISIHCLST